jgi:nicotinate-nucleotide adenylyltransferase
VSTAPARSGRDSAQVSAPVAITAPRPALPPHAPGLRIGLFGGSFNPPHQAHRAVSLLALKRLQLDRVWWLVTPGNPLKDTRRLPPLAARMKAAEALAADRRIVVTGLEAALGTVYTADTLRALRHHAPGVRFVWLMGADNLSTLHLWRNWQEILHLVPIAVIDRGDAGLKAMAAPAARAFARFRIPEQQAATLAQRDPPAWLFLHGVKSALSSTALRQRSGGE